MLEESQLKTSLLLDVLVSQETAIMLKVQGFGSKKIDS